MGKGEGRFYKQIYSNIESEERRGEEGWRDRSWSPERGSSTFQWLRIGNRFDFFFFFNVKYFGGESEIF